jgi:hypothetical protein
MNTIDLEKEIKKKLREQKDKEYGDYKENMGLIAFLWSVILKDKLKSDVKPYEAANMMVMLWQEIYIKRTRHHVKIIYKKR